MSKVLALVEHVDRELDLVCLVKLLLGQRHGIELKIANFYADAPLLLAGAAPRVLLTPFFYGADDAVLKDYVAAWPKTRLVNLAWEQVFYPSHQAIKAPRDQIARERVTHLAWSQSFVDYMVANGVTPAHMKLVGHGVYRLYQPPYRAYFPSREVLAARHGLDPDKRWVFVPENYRWAFFTDGKLKRLAKQGVEHAELVQMRDYCRSSLTALLKWCAALAGGDGVELVFRPRPATSVEEITGFADKALGKDLGSVRILKDGSAREWVLASDVVASSYSTVLIEAALAGKAILKVEAEPIPPGLHYDWCDLVPGVATEAAFISACLEPDADSGKALRAWAEAMFFSTGDPVSALVEAIAQEVKAAASGPRPVRHATGAQRLPLRLRLTAPFLSPEERRRAFQAKVPDYFFNHGTHEKDLFGAAEIGHRVRGWRDALRPY